MKLVNLYLGTVHIVCSEPWLDALCPLSFGQSYQTSAFHSASWSDAQRTHLKSSLLTFGCSKLSNNYIPHKNIIGCIPAFDEAGDPSWYFVQCP